MENQRSSSSKKHDEVLIATETFASSIYAAVNYYRVKPGDMARKFGVNPSTIARWASGKNAPHVMVRPIIIDWVRKYVRGRA
jgi:DNA-binding transcriptional regulator YiaG